MSLQGTEREGAGAALRTVVDHCHFVESPRWHDGHLWFVDITARLVMAVDEEGAIAASIAVDWEPGGIGWLPDGRLLAVSTMDRKVLRREADGMFVEHVDLSALTPWPLNDMAVDRAGRCFVGGFGYDQANGAPPMRSPLYVVEVDGSVRTTAAAFLFPNGMAFAPGGQLLVSESAGSRVSALRIRDEEVSVSCSTIRSWADLRQAQVGAASQPRPVPDGLCVDSEGAAWVADVRNRRVLRLADGGALLDVVEVGRTTFACALGGSDGRTLFVCVGDLPLTGSTAAVLATRVAVPALPGST